jgi:hypothetical protein
MITSKRESEMLMNALLPLAEKMLKEYGEFYPYAGCMKLDGSIVDIGATDPDTDRPKSKDHAHRSCPARQFPYPLLKPVHRLRRNPPLWYACVREAKAQELPFPWARRRALLRIHLELELHSEESR